MGILPVIGVGTDAGSVSAGGLVGAGAAVGTTIGVPDRLIKRPATNPNTMSKMAIATRPASGFDVVDGRSLLTDHLGSMIFFRWHYIKLRKDVRIRRSSGSYLIKAVWSRYPTVAQAHECLPITDDSIACSQYGSRSADDHLQCHHSPDYVPCLLFRRVLRRLECGSHIVAPAALTIRRLSGRLSCWSWGCSV